MNGVIYNWVNNLAKIFSKKFLYFLYNLNPIHDEEEGRRGQKGLHTSFSPVTSTNVGTSPKTFWLLVLIKIFWLLVLIVFPHWCKISVSYLVPVPNYWTWTKTTPQKSVLFFCSNPYKVEVMMISFIEMLELPNFCLMTSSTI